MVLVFYNTTSNIWVNLAPIFAKTESSVFNVCILVGVFYSFNLQFSDN